MELRVTPRLRYLEGREMFDRPEGIVDCAGEIDGVLRTWKEYVPSGYDGTECVPLVVTLHGGRSGKGQNNHRAELTTAWALVAEREGFIVVYPQSLTPEYAWSAWEDFSDGKRTRGLKDDLCYLDLLLDRIWHKYRIDKTRVYLHGQSFGDVMGTYYLLMRPGNPFAAAALLSGPVGAGRYFRPDGTCLFGPECSLPVVRTHGSADLFMPMGRYQHLEDQVPTYDYQAELTARNASPNEVKREKMVLQQLPGIELWKRCNGCSGFPRLSVRGRYNAAAYQGNQDFYFYMVENGGHGPSMDMADFIWSYFFSGYRYLDGMRKKVPPERIFEEDRYAVILANGSSRAYVDNRLVQMCGKASRTGSLFYIPVFCISEVFPELEVDLEEQGTSVRISRGNQVMQLSACNRTFVWCGYLEHGERTLMEGNILMVPVGQVAGKFYGHKAKYGYDICYLSGHDGEITFDLAFLVRQLLGTEPVMSPKELWNRENGILEKAQQPGYGMEGRREADGNETVSREQDSLF